MLVVTNGYYMFCKVKLTRQLSFTESLLVCVAAVLPSFFSEEYIELLHWTTSIKEKHGITSPGMDYYHKGERWYYLAWDGLLLMTGIAYGMIIFALNFIEHDFQDDER